MDNNDYIGSFAQENVSFQTQIVKTASVGDNYWKVMVFLESNRFITDPTAFVSVAGSDTITAATVTAETFASVTSGLLQSWLTDLFVNGFTGDVYLVNVGVTVGTTSTVYSVVTPTGTENPSTEGWYERSGTSYVLSTDTTVDTGKTYYTAETVTADAATFNAAMTEAYQLLKAHAYWKVACAGDDTVTATLGMINAALADLCSADKALLSGPVCLPFTTQTAADVGSDPIYNIIKDKYVFMSCHADATRNTALYSLGLALSTYNGSGTPVGNNFDMVKSSSITASGPDGTDLGRSIRSMLNSLNIQTFKPIGNNTGDVAAEGDTTLTGDIVSAQWIICYVAYMTKVRVAEMITVPNFYKSEANYTRILGVLQDNLSKFGAAGSGRLKGLSITAPSFNALPPADSDTITIPNAWVATYVNHVRKVNITGTLYIEV